MSLLTVLILGLLQAGSGTPSAVFLQYNNAICNEEWQTSWDLLSQYTRDWLYDAYMVEKHNAQQSDEALREWNARGITDMLSYWTEVITKDLKNWKKSHETREIISEEVNGNEAKIKYKNYKHTATIYMVKEKGAWKLDLVR